MIFVLWVQITSSKWLLVINSMTTTLVFSHIHLSFVKNSYFIVLSIAMAGIV